MKADDDALLRLRTIRRDAYRCRYPLGYGRECGRRGSTIALHGGEYITVCNEHAHE